MASLLLSAATRRQVMAFYHFARTADDVADDPTLPADTKLARLDALEEALAGRGESCDVVSALALRQAVNGDEELLAQAAQLLQAFRRDAVVDHCRDWGDLMMYCRFSAAPVGRFLLQLHGEAPATFGPSDSLCAALQVLNHLQDCALDLSTLGRVYVPLAWLRSAGLELDALVEDSTSPQLRDVLDIALDHVDGLIDLARPLPSRINSRRLRLQASITLVVAERLSAKLRRGDPLARRVALSPLDYARAVAAGLWRGWSA